MADLIAQGPDPQQRWRRSLSAGQPFVLGREAAPWSVGWDDQVSRRHVELCWSQGRLRVHKLDTGLNPVFVRGQEVTQFELRPGEHFVIGRTTFALADEQVHISLDVPDPIRQQTFSPQYLERLRFHNADQRLEVLSRLPEVISGSTSESELFVRLVNMLLAGIPRAGAAALVSADQAAITDHTGGVRVLHWDRRLSPLGNFEPSRRLILEALQGRQSVLHVWSAREQGGKPAFTASENLDWAFCTPMPGEACPGWAIYVAGRFQLPTASPVSDPTDLSEDLKFTELVAATLNSLRHVQQLERKNASLSQFFPPAVLDALAANPQMALVPRECDVSVLFCDLRGFSLQAEQSAGNLLALLERVSKALGVMTHHILQQQGVIGDFQGDAAMGFWGWPLAQDDTVASACRAALAIRREFEAASRTSGHPLANFQVGIGLASGRAVAGGIGTIDQLKVTVFGPVVNLASRLEGMTKTIRAPILLDETTARLARQQLPSDAGRIRRVAVVRPYGLDTALEVSELLPPLADHPQLTDDHLASYEAAVDCFLAGRWTDALELLHQVPARDRVKDFLTIFIAQHNRTPPPGWDKVIPLSSKG